MNRLAFFIDNKKVSDIDFSNPLAGNPGTGATEYMTVLMVYLLSQRNRDVVLYLTNPGVFPKEIRTQQVSDVFMAIQISAQKKQIIVIRSYLTDMQSILSYVKDFETAKIIIWAHLTPSQFDLRQIAKMKQIIKIICVENNQRIRMIDNPCYKKAVTIPYGISKIAIQRDFDKIEKNVVFMGALVPQKGFHLLADAWRVISVNFPGVKLYVVGSGQLYSKQIELGPKGVAIKKYENRIFQKLERNDKNVIFVGSVGPEERLSIFQKCSVAVVNPSGSTETFCLSGVELQQFGLPVVSARKFGLLDTVKHKKSGYLISHPRFLSSRILKLLKNEEKNKIMGIFGQVNVNNKYELNKIVLLWESLFDFLATNEKNALAEEILKLKIKSIQGVTGVLNRYLVLLFPNSWPTQVESWHMFKSVIRFLLNQIQNVWKRLGK